MGFSGRTKKVREVRELENRNNLDRSAFTPDLSPSSSASR
jgi:hypothetical protein